MLDAIQRVEIRLVVLGVAAARLEFAPEIERVERAQGQRIDHRHRGDERKSRPAALARVRLLAERRLVVGTHEPATAEIGAARAAIHPGHGVFVVAIRGCGQLEELIQIRKAQRVHVHVRAFDTLERDRGTGEQAGQTQAAHGGREPLGIVVRRAYERAAVRAQQLQFAYMTAECTGHVVILAVDIVGNRAPYRYELRARCDR